MNHFRHTYNLGDHWWKKFKKHYKDFYDFVFDNEKYIYIIYDKNNDHIMTYVPHEGTVFSDLPINKIYEDAMGGVSAPMSTLNNTPGVGNVVPGGIGKMGSGDKFGNTFNKKPYTQSVKKKKRTIMKKTKKVEENNINPFDKIGVAMAKQMKITLPFKKKKNSTNQNAIVQRKFEHEIITLDNFTQILNESRKLSEFTENTLLNVHSTSGATFTSTDMQTTLKRLQDGGWNFEDDEIEKLKQGESIIKKTYNRVGTPRKDILKRADILK